LFLGEKGLGEVDLGVGGNVFGVFLVCYDYHPRIVVLCLDPVDVSCLLCEANCDRLLLREKMDTRWEGERQLGTYKEHEIQYNGTVVSIVFQC